MKILVYGGRGWIGAMMVELLEERGHTVVLGEARLDNYPAVLAEVERVAPERVFSSTGRTHGIYQGKVYGTIDYLELPGGLEVNIRDNLRGPLNLAMVCRERGIHLTYMGTGCIFQYDANHRVGDQLAGFTEEDLPNFFGSGYSTVKGQTDLIMRNFGDSVLNCRIRMPIVGENNPRNFITKIISYQKICSIPNSMTVLPEILPIMADLLEQGETGTYNLTNPGLITHNQILEMYRDSVDNEFKWENFTLEEQSKVLLSGRSNNCLDTAKLEEYCQKRGLKLNQIENAVERLMKSYSK